MNPKTRSAFRISGTGNSDNAENPPVAGTIESILDSISPWQQNHPYPCAQGLPDAPGHVYTGTDEVGGVQCHGSAVLIIHDLQGEPVNALLMVKNAESIFEDVLLPNAKVAGCHGRVGTATETILIVETYASALALHAATGNGVVVALYADNLLSVAANMKSKYPSKTIIICAETRSEFDGITNLAALSAAIEAGAFIAYPDDAQTFNELHHLQGLDKIRQCIENAAPPKQLLLPSEKNQSGIPVEPSMWPNPVNGTALMADMLAKISRHVVLDICSVLALCIWIFLTHVIEAIRVTPILALSSPVRRCGKTTVLGILFRLVFRPLASSNLTPAVLFRTMEAWKPSLLVDEADTHLGKSEELIGIFNAGHTRETAFVTRIGAGNMPQRFNVFGAKAIAGIGTLPDTMMDRSIVITLRRKRHDERVEKQRFNSNDEFTALRPRIARWCHDNHLRIKCAEAPSIELGNDRASDNWEPFLSIAQCLGGNWIERAKQAAIQLSTRHDDMKCSGEELLRDIHSIFHSSNSNRIQTSTLLAELCSDAEKPWASFNNGRAVTARDISNLLSDFDIKSKNLRIGAMVVKGYEFDQFEDAFARYVHA